MLDFKYCFNRKQFLLFVLKSPPGQYRLRDGPGIAKRKIGEHASDFFWFKSKLCKSNRTIVDNIDHFGINRSSESVHARVCHCVGPNKAGNFTKELIELIFIQ